MSEHAEQPSALCFKGWIPTVAGNLTFDRFGHTNFPSRSIGGSIGKGRQRVTFCFQKRILKDGVIPELLLRVQHGRHSKFCFAAAGFVDETDCLSGFVYVFSYTLEPRESQWRSVRHRINDPERQDSLIQQMHDHAYDDPKAWWKTFGENYHGFLQRTALFTCGFKIERCGITTITIRKPLLPERLTFGSNNEEVECATELASQVFFFLRDVTHVHQHHPETNDTMTDVYRVGDGDGQLDWMKETAYELFRFVIRHKQNRNLQYCLSGKGVIAYLTTLMEIVKLEDPDWQAAYRLERVRDSIDVKIQEFEYALRRRIHAITAAVSPAIAVVAIFVACANLAKSGTAVIPRHWLLQWFERTTMIDFPYLLGASTLLPFLFHFLIWGVDGIPRVCRESTLLGVARLMQGMSKHRTIAISFALAMAFVTVAIGAFWLFAR
jgi:hypothetical protein